MSGTHTQTQTQGQIQKTKVRRAQILTHRTDGQGGQKTQGERNRKFKSESTPSNGTKESALQFLFLYATPVHYW